MIQKLHILKVYFDENKKTTWGDPRVGLQTTEYGSRWLNGSAKLTDAISFKKDVEDAKGKYEAELEVYEAEKIDPKTNKPYLNWKKVSQDKKAEVEITGLKQQISALNKRIEVVESYCNAHAEGKLPSDFSAERVNARKAEIEAKINPEDIPF